MAIAALVRIDLERDLTANLPHSEILLLKSLQELKSVLSNGFAATVVVDPEYACGREPDRLVSIMKAHPRVPVVAYVPLRVPSLNAIIACSRHDAAFYDVIVQSRGLPRGAVQRIVEKANASGLIEDLLAPLQAHIGCLPCSISLVLADVFACPSRYTTAVDIAIEAKVTVKILYRSFERAGLGTPKKVLTVAKILRGYWLLRDAPMSVKVVAHMLGYSRLRTFSENCDRFLGCSPARLGLRQSREQLITRLRDWLCEPLPSEVSAS
jgi:AraC-like DNA-binding protein